MNKSVCLKRQTFKKANKKAMLILAVARYYPKNEQEWRYYYNEFAPFVVLRV